MKSFFMYTNIIFAVVVVKNTKIALKDRQNLTNVSSVAALGYLQNTDRLKSAENTLRQLKLVGTYLNLFKVLAFLVQAGLPVLQHPRQRQGRHDRQVRAVVRYCCDIKLRLRRTTRQGGVEQWRI